MIGFFKAWLGSPTAKAEALLNAWSLAGAVSRDHALVGPVAKVAMIDHEGGRQVRSVFECASSYFLWVIDDPTYAKRVLPHGRFEAKGKASHIKAWEAIDPPDWQPARAETANELARRLEAENAALKERVSASQAAFKVIALAAQEGGRT